MYFYPTFLVFHILFAGIWLINFLSDSVLKKQITVNRGRSGEKKFILLYLKFGNLLGMIGAIGILVTGVVMVSLNPGYGFFQMTANHWLATKQIIMVIILAVIFMRIIPESKKVKREIGTELENSTQLSDQGYATLTKLYKFTTLINVFVIINFLLAITHRFFG